jgi:glycosyltransferase involved in cell wall biosynthesis
MSVATLLREGVAARDRPAGTRPLQASARSIKPHVCFVAPHAWPVFSRDPAVQVVGGAEVQQSILARLLQRAGYRVSMICLDFGQPQRVEADGVTVCSAYRPDAGVPVLRFFHPRLTAMWRTLRQVDADVYYHRSAAMLTAVVAQFCRRYGKRSVYAGASDMDFLPGQEPIRFGRDRWLYQRGLRSVDAIVAQNTRQVEACRKHYAREAYLIPSCYELPQDSRPAQGEVVLWCGTVHANKRPDLLLDLARRLPHRRFVIVGGPGHDDEPGRHGYFESIRAQAAALCNVECTGFLPLAQAEPWFDRARVLVNTSVYEGMPNTFMQAWARGIPTLATVDVGAPVQRVFADPAAGAAQIEEFFRDEARYGEASAACRAYFERNHSPREVLGKYAALFQALASA